MIHSLIKTTGYVVRGKSNSVSEQTRQRTQSPGCSDFRQDLIFRGVWELRKEYTHWWSIVFIVWRPHSGESGLAHQIH